MKLALRGTQSVPTERESSEMTSDGKGNTWLADGSLEATVSGRKRASLTTAAKINLGVNDDSGLEEQRSLDSCPDCCPPLFHRPSMGAGREPPRLDFFPPPASLATSWRPPAVSSQLHPLA